MYTQLHQLALSVLHILLIVLFPTFPERLKMASSALARTCWAVETKRAGSLKVKRGRFFPTSSLTAIPVELLCTLVISWLLLVEGMADTLHLLCDGFLNVSLKKSEGLTPNPEFYTWLSYHIISVWPFCHSINCNNDNYLD